MNKLLLYIGIALAGLFLCPSAKSQAFMPTWTSVSSNLLVNNSTNVLIKNGVNGWNCGARSQEVLASGTDGWVELRFTAYNKSGANGAFGLASTNPDHGITYMEYAYYVTATSVSAYASGSLIATSTISTNDVLRISKVGSTVSYLVNGTAIATRTITTPVNLFVDMGIRNHSCYMQGLVCSFGSYQSHVWNNLVAMTESGGQLTRTGTSAASAYSKNFLPPTQTGFIEYTNLTSHSHGANWYWGFSSAPGAYSTWEWAVRINANSDTAAFYNKGTLIASMAIANNDVLRLDYVGDRVVLSQNNTVKSDQNHFVAVPLVFSITSPGTSGSAIYNADFTMSFASTSKYLHVTTTEVDGDTPASATLTDYGFGSGTKESLWSDEFVTRAEWDAEWAALDPEIRQLLDTLPYDDVFATKSMTLGFADPGEGKVWFHQLSPDTVVSSNYKIANKSDVKTNTGYVFTNNVVSKSTTSTGRFILENGSIPGATDGEISFQIFHASATVRVGFSPIGSSAVSNGSHMTHFFSVNAGNVFPVVNGTSITINRAYGLGDVLTIRITGTSMQFLINSTVVHTATLAGTENLQAEVFYNTNPTTNKTYVKVLQNTLTNVYKGKKLRVTVTHASCDGAIPGSATMPYAPKDWTPTPSYVVKDLADNTVVYSGSSSSWSGLNPGNYEVVVSYGMTSLPPFYFSIGYEIDWTSWIGTNYSLTGSGNARLLTHTNSATIDVLKSRNKLLPGESGWISWEAKDGFDWGFFGSGLMSSQNVTQGILTVPGALNYYYLPAEDCQASSGSTYFDQTVYHGFRIDREATSVDFIKGNTSKLECLDAPVEGTFRTALALFFLTSGIIKNAAASFPCRDIAPAMTELHRKLDAGYFIVPDTDGDDLLKFRYYEEYNVAAVTCKIYRIGGEGNTEITSLSEPVIYGDNRLAINLTANSFSPGDDFYMLEVINSKNEKWYLKFRY